MLRCIRTFLQESGDESAEAKDAGRGELDVACGGVGGFAAGGRVAGAGGGGPGVTAGGGGGAGVVRGVGRVGRVGGGSTGARCGAATTSARDDSCAGRGVDDDGRGAADRDLEGSQGARDVDRDVSDTLGETCGDGGDGRLGGDGRRESGLGGLNGGHAGNDAVAVGHGEVGGEAVGVGHGRLEGGAAAGDLNLN